MNNRYEPSTALRREISLSITAWVAVMVCVAQAQAAVRVGLFSQDTTVTNEVSLAYTQLAETTGIELVERDELHRAIDEQTLSATGVIDAQHAVAIGKVVKA